MRTSALIKETHPLAVEVVTVLHEVVELVCHHAEGEDVRREAVAAMLRGGQGVWVVRARVVR